MAWTSWWTAPSSSVTAWTRWSSPRWHDGQAAFAVASTLAPSGRRGGAGGTRCGASGRRIVARAMWLGWSAVGGSVGVGGWKSWWSLKLVCTGGIGSWCRRLWNFRIAAAEVLVRMKSCWCFHASGSGRRSSRGSWQSWRSRAGSSYAEECGAATAVCCGCGARCGEARWKSTPAIRSAAVCLFASWRCSDCGLGTRSQLVALRRN